MSERDIIIQDLAEMGLGRATGITTVEREALAEIVKNHASIRCQLSASSAREETLMGDMIIIHKEAAAGTVNLGWIAAFASKALYSSPPVPASSKMVDVEKLRKAFIKTCPPMDALDCFDAAIAASTKEI